MVKGVKKRILNIFNLLLALLGLQIVKRNAKDRFIDALFMKKGIKLYPEIQSKCAKVL